MLPSQSYDLKLKLQGGTLISNLVVGQMCSGKNSILHLTNLIKFLHRSNQIYVVLLTSRFTH